jgi:hypothetical protein
VLEVSFHFSKSGVDDKFHATFNAYTILAGREEDLGKISMEFSDTGRAGNATKATADA